MNFLRTLSFYSLVFLFSIPAFAQTPVAAGKITGKLVDEKNKPVEFATITLLRADSSVVNGDLTKEDGSFKIESTGFGSFILRINAIGFTTKFIDNISLTAAAPDKAMGKITAALAVQGLNGVEVVGEKVQYEMSIDKKVFNVDKSITATGGTAADVLQNVPSVSVDVDGNVSLRGKSGVTILIDGKPATLLAGDVASALQSLPASSIESVEVITNPSAKYDAQGMNGILNIITRKDRKFGFNGSASLGAGTRDKYNGSLNLNLKNEKWNVFLNSSLKLNRNYNINTTERKNKFNDTGYYSAENSVRRFNGFFNTLGAEYIFDKNNSVTITENLNFMQWGNNGTTVYDVHNSQAVLNAQKRVSDNLGGPVSSSSSLDYKHKFTKPAQEFTANATFAKMWVERTQEFITTGYDGNETIMYGPVIQDAPGAGGNTSFNAQADFTSPFFTTKGKLDAGLKTQLYWFESGNHATIDSGAGLQPDLSLQNNYHYDQKIYAAYINFSDQKDKWGYQLGLRTEYSKYSGTTEALNGQVYSNEFLNLFPSAYISLKASKHEDVYLSYTLRTNRPDFFKLMPYRDVANPQDTSMGNPGLIPEFIHNTELNYNRQFEKGHNIMASFYYQYTQNMIERVRTFYDNGTSFSQPQNLGSGLTYGFELTGKAQLLPVWDAMVNINLFRNQINVGSNNPSLVNNSGFSWFGKFNTNIKLPAGFSLQVNGNYEAPKVAAQGNLKEVYWLDMGLKKNIRNNKINITLNISDIFDTKKYTTVYDYHNYIQTNYRNRETRIGNLTFTYRFGKSDTKNNTRKKAQQNGNQQPVKERNNIKGDDGDGGF